MHLTIREIVGLVLVVIGGFQCFGLFSISPLFFLSGLTFILVGIFIARSSKSHGPEDSYPGVDAVDTFTVGSDADD